MRIGFVAPLVTAISEPQLGGSQALLADIATGLSERGHEVVVFAASGSRIADVEVVDTGIDPSLLAATFFRASEDVTGFDIVRDAFAHVYGFVRAKGLESAFDVVHNHAFDAPAIELGRVDVPIVHTLHLPPVPSIADAVTHARTGFGNVVVACVSEHSAAAWRESVVIDAVLRNGVPVDRIPWSDVAGERLLFAGRFSPEKGAAEAIEIALGAGLPITLAGSAYDERYAAERIDPFREHPDVEIVDAVPRAELWRMMAASRAVLCPVAWDEPFGLVGAEAQAAGTPVVAFDRGALAEVIVDGTTGRLVGSVPEAVDAVRGIDSIDRRACRAHAETDLSLEATIDAHVALYERLVRELSRPSV